MFLLCVITVADVWCIILYVFVVVRFYRWSGVLFCIHCLSVCSSNRLSLSVCVGYCVYELHNNNNNNNNNKSGSQSDTVAFADLFSVHLVYGANCTIFELPR